MKDGTIKAKFWIVHQFIKFNGNDNLKRTTKEEVEKYILHRREKCKPKTVHNDIIDLRLFFKWLIPDNDFFEGVKSKAPRNHLPIKELILPDDVKRLVAATNTQRDRALLMVLWDSAARISEILDLNIGDLEFDKYGCVCIVEGKTGMRRLRLIESVPDLQLWCNMHPDRDNRSAPLFPVTRKRDGKFSRLNIRTVENLFKTVARDAAITKNVHPHGFRHGRLTDLVKRGFGEMELRVLAGWGADSAMPATYIHIAGRDVDKKMLALHGVIEDDTEEQVQELKPIECPRCKTKNPYDAKYCSTCSMVLDAETAIKLDEATKIADSSITDIMGSRFEELKKAIVNEMLDKMKN
jgi:integrase